MNKFINMWYYTSIITFIISTITMFVMLEFQVNSSIGDIRYIINIGNIVTIIAISLLLSIVVESFIE